MSHPLIHADEPDADIDDLAPMHEIEFDDSDDVETALELDLLLSRLHATRFLGY